ncbi:hypothetical protein ACLOJK_031664 [Asimina triloba]
MALVALPFLRDVFQQDRLESEGAEFFVLGGRDDRDKRKSVAQEAKLQSARGAAPRACGDGEEVARHPPRRAVQRLRAWDAEIPEGCVHGQPQVRHFSPSKSRCVFPYPFCLFQMTTAETASRRLGVVVGGWGLRLPRGVGLGGVLPYPALNFGGFCARTRLMSGQACRLSP